MFENRVLRSICGHKWDQVTGDWIKLHSGEFNDLYSPTNIICAIKSRKMRWTDHVSSMGERRGAHGILVEKPEGKNHLEDLDVDGKIILKYILRKWIVGAWNRLIWLMIGQVADSCECGFHKMRTVSSLTENRLAFQEGLSSTE
jgi:hypothetical protein